MLCRGVIKVLGGKCCFAANSFIVPGSPSNPMLLGGNLNAMVAIVVLGFNFYIVPYFIVLARVWG